MDFEEILERYGERMTLAPGEVVCRQGSVSDGVYYLKSGWLGVYWEEEGEPYLLSIIAPGEMVGEIGAATGQPRVATVVAARECEVIHISDANFQQAMQEAPTLVAKVVGTMGERLASADVVRITMSQSYHRSADRVQALRSEKTRLEELLRLREEMSDMIVHDLRNPLGVIKTGLDLLARVQVVESDSEYSAHVIQTIEKSTKRMQRLVDTLLDIARLEKGAMALSMGPVDLGVLVEDTLADLLPLAEKGDVTLDSRLPEGLPLALGDWDVIERVLVNLVDNALRFTLPVGQVWVEAQAEEEDVRVDVVDTGTGVPPEERTRVFEKFTRGRGRRGSQGGVGLGLTFCQMAVEAHGGRIWIEDGPDGKGSRFSFTLPQAHEIADG
jgi:signal transduction histidine kinase